MSVGSKGRWYNDPEAAANASFAPAVYASGANTLGPFDIENADELLAALLTHNFLHQTTQAANANLDFIALASGAATTAIQVAYLVAGNNTPLSVAASTPTLTTSLTGNNNDLVFTAVGQNYGASISYVDPSANNQNLQLEVHDDSIIVHLATGPAGAITSTAAQISAAIKADARASALVTVANAGGNDGTGVVTAMAATAVAASSTINVNIATGSGGAATSTASQVLAAVNADARASSLVVARLASGNTGAGVVAAAAAAALAVWPGTLPTLDVKFQTTADGTNYVDAGTAFAQKTTPAAAEARVFNQLGTRGQWIATVGGSATPLAACSVGTLKKIQ